MSKDSIGVIFNIFVFGALFEFALMVGMIIGARYYQRKKRAELVRLEKMKQELD